MNFGAADLIVRVCRPEDLGRNSVGQPLLLLSSEPWSSNSNRVYSVEGADAVI